LIVVDVQRDFLPGGSLAVPDGDAVIAPLNAYIGAFDARDLPIVFTRDWHPANHCSFKVAGGSWPVHCVQETSGASWAEDLDVTPADQIISKGADPSREAYSAFSGTTLLSLLRELGVHRVFVGGLATDYCVCATVCDARTHGFDVVVLADAIRAVNVQPDDEVHAMQEMEARGAKFFRSNGALVAAPSRSATPAPSVRST
jgi:nicotinamidase/pyrazinamidase